MTRNEERCHVCNAPLVRETRAMEYTYKGDTLSLEQPGLWCSDSCDDGVLSAEDLAATAPALEEWKRAVNGTMSPADVKAAREAIGLNKSEAGEVLGGGPNAFQKYEAGTVTPSQSRTSGAAESRRPPTNTPPG